MVAEMVVYIKYSRAWNQYVVPSPEGTEATSFQTDDRAEALEAAAEMWKDVSSDIEFRIR